MDKKDNNMNKLRAKLKAKISEKKISRGNKKQKDRVLTDTFREHGIDREEFLKNIEVLKRAGASVQMERSMEYLRKLESGNN